MKEKFRLLIVRKSDGTPTLEEWFIRPLNHEARKACSKIPTVTFANNSTYTEGYKHYTPFL